MKTLDIRLYKYRKEKRRKSENFGDNINGCKVNTLNKDHSEKAESKFSNNNKNEDERVDVFEKANIFKRKLLARMTSLVKS